jgi:hypothetical protein
LQVRERCRRRLREGGDAQDHEEKSKDYVQEWKVAHFCLQLSGYINQATS